MNKNNRSLPTAVLGAAVIFSTSSLASAALLVVDAASGADLVLNVPVAPEVGTFDSEEVPPSGSANIYASLDGGTTLLNSGNSNADLAWSQTVTSGTTVITLIHENFGGTVAELYGFDLFSADGTTLLYDGSVNAGNANTGDAAFTTALPTQAFVDPFNGDTVTVTFTAGAAGSLGSDRVSNIDSIPGGSGNPNDTAHTLSITVTPVPEPSSAVLAGFGVLSLLLCRRR